MKNMIFTPFFSHLYRASGLVGKMALFSETKWPTLFSRQRENVRKTPLPRRLVR